MSVKPENRLVSPSAIISERNKKCDNIRAKLGIDPDAVVVVSTGRITKDKGFDVLKDVICNKTSWDNVVFLIVGDGEYLPIMKKEMAEKGLGDTVIFTGYRSDVLDILRASDIFIICSYHETFCISVVEASGEGLPVIATNIGGIPEIVDNGVSGMLVAAGDTKGFIDSLIELIDNPTRRKKMGSKGRDIVQQHFSETIIADKLGDMYERLLQIKK